MGDGFVHVPEDDTDRDAQGKCVWCKQVECICEVEDKVKHDIYGR
jgi:hypothetical protein